MSQILRQSTQVVVRIGVVVAVGDGFTPVTTLSLATADEAELLKAAGAATVSIAGNTFAAITGADGWYDLTLTTTDTNTIGTLDVVVNDDSLCLPVHARFQVIEEAAYDTIYAASALPASTTNITAGTITTATNVTTVNGLAANVITATSINADAITAAKVAADVSAEIADAVWDEDATGHQTGGTFGQAIGDPVADTNTIFKAVVTDAAGATVGVDVVAVKAETAAILDDTDDIGVAGAGLTAINLPDQTMNITGDITGNLSGSVGSVTGAVGSVTAGVSVAAGGIASTAFAAGAIDAAAIAANAIGASELAQDAAREIADEVLDRDIAGGGSGNTRNVRNALRAIRNKVTEAGGTLTVTAEDDLTPAWTAAVTRTAGQDPITGVDPA